MSDESTPQSQQPRKASGLRLNLIWLVPLVSLLLGVWLVHREYKEKGPVIEISMANGAGISAGKTPLLYRGMEVGMVSEVMLTDQLDGVSVKIELEPGAASLAAEGSEFWLEQPEIGLSGVRGLETLLSGTRLHVRPAKVKGAHVDKFRLRAKAPADELHTDSRTFVLVNDKLAGLNPGTAVYYREVKVGVIEQHRLSPDSTQVWIGVKVFSPYDKLVRKSTCFWISGGLNVKVGLLGASMQSNSLESLIAGGVSLATPTESATEELAPEGTRFELFSDPEKAWLKWKPAIVLNPEVK